MLHKNVFNKEINKRASIYVKWKAINRIDKEQTSIQTVIEHSCEMSFGREFICLELAWLENREIVDGKGIEF